MTIGVQAGAFAAVGVSAPIQLRGRFNVTLAGTFTAAVQIERSFDDGDTWHPCTNLGAAVHFTAPCSEVGDEPEGGLPTGTADPRAPEWPVAP